VIANKPIPVTIVRPRDPVSTIVVSLSRAFLSSYFLMLILGVLTTWHVSYWHSVLIVLGAGLLRGDIAYLSWSRAGKKDDAA